MDARRSGGRTWVGVLPDVDVEVGVTEDASKQGDEAEEGPPPTKGAVRARGKVSVAVQGVQRLSAREEALSVQGVRRVSSLRARS